MTLTGQGQGQGHVTYLGQNRGLRPLIIFDRLRSNQGQGQGQKSSCTFLAYLSQSRNLRP